jgi:hypothetical protein
MAKTKNNKRKRNTQQPLPQKVLKSSTLLPTPLADVATAVDTHHLKTIVSDEELETTIETLSALSEYPSLTKSKACKDLRVAVYDFRRACTTGLDNAGTFSPIVLARRDS